MSRLISCPGIDFINPFFPLHLATFLSYTLHISPHEVFGFNIELCSLRNITTHNIDLCLICPFYRRKNVISNKVLICRLKGISNCL